MLLRSLNRGTIGLRVHELATKITKYTKKKENPNLVFPPVSRLVFVSFVNFVVQLLERTTSEDVRGKLFEEVL